MASMATIVLPQVVSYPTQLVGHNMHMVFCAGWEDGNLGVKEFSVLCCCGQITSMGQYGTKTFAKVGVSLQWSASGE